MLLSKCSGIHRRGVGRVNVNAWRASIACFHAWVSPSSVLELSSNRLTRKVSMISKHQYCIKLSYSNSGKSSDSDEYVSKLIDMYSQPEINMTELMIGRHAQSDAALHYVDVVEDVHGVQGDITCETFTHADCERYSSQLASLLEKQGLKKGDRVAVMLPKSPQLVIASLGLWRLGYVFVPLFAAFERDAIKVRLLDSQAKVVVTDTINRQKFDFISDEEDIDVKFLTTIIDSKLDNKSGQDSMIRDTDEVYSLSSFKQQKETPLITPVIITPNDAICLLYTSGTTGLPKGVTIPAFALASFHAYMELGLGLASKTSSASTSLLAGTTSSQRYLSIADPAWAYGLYYNLIGPLLIGVPPTYLAGGFNALKLLRTLAKTRITHFAAAPSAYRALCAYDQSNSNIKDDQYNEKESSFDVVKNNLLCASSAGEPLNPEIIDWWRSRMNGRSIADHYGQSETGMTVNWHWANGMTAPLGDDNQTQQWTLKGSMGKGMAGFRMVCLSHKDGVVDEEIMNEPGELAVDLASSPLMWFQGYLNNPQRTSEAISYCKRYYLTGDTVTHKESDAKGDIFWFSTRKDDVIKSSGVYNRCTSYFSQSVLNSHDVKI